MAPIFRRLSFTFATMLVLLPFSSVQAQTFYAWLNGLNESPVNASAGIGSATVTLNQTLNTMRVQVVFSGLIGPTTQAHIHCCTTVPNTATVGVATELPSFTGFPLGVFSGVYDHTFDMTQTASWGATFLAANAGNPTTAFASFTTGMLQERAYLNIHSSSFPGGEIRGFLQVVPEPSTYALMASGLIALCFVANRRRKA